MMQKENQKKKYRGFRTSRLLMGFLVILALVLSGVCIYAVTRNLQKQTQTIPDNGSESENMAASESDARGQQEKWQEGVIRYQGRQYRYNSAIKNYLFLGIDRKGTAQKAEDGISGGQSDAIFLLVENAKNKTFSIVAVNRNAMTNIDVYDREGNFVEQTMLPICLQHGYGDGLRTSCLRSVEAVSRMFYDLPISGYLSLYMDGIPRLNDAVGGVVLDGETLDGQEAYTYVRSRDTDKFDSATERLERQKEYILQFMAQAGELVSQDQSAALRIYHSISDYLVTNLDFADMAEDFAAYDFDQASMYTVPGETMMGLLYEEFYIDEEALYELILEVFYEPVE